MEKLTPLIFFISLLLIGAEARGYPLDGALRTGISRLTGYELIQQGKAVGIPLPEGALLPMAEVTPRLLNAKALSLNQPDPEFTRKIAQLLGDDREHYSIAVLDCSRQHTPRLALHRENAAHNPGSVGKLLVALALFQTLADIYPDDLQARERILRESIIEAGSIIQSDHHTVPFWNEATLRLTHRPLHEGDSANLWTFLDWMLSASSNAAASVVIRELILMKSFGVRYPPTTEDKERFFMQTSKQQLSSLLVTTLQQPVERNGLDSSRLRQGSFFTKEGKRRISGTNSTATCRELLQFLLFMEQGRLVDSFSSCELKRLLYMTQRRIRYASSPVLTDAAVYFKSGSFFKCRPEPDFKCRKYQGNVFNLMNSVAVIETPTVKRRLFYMVVVLSDVLRKNSAVDHQTLATRIHRLIAGSYPGADGQDGSLEESPGQSDHPAPR